MLDVIAGIEAFCARKGIARVADLTGAMRARRDFREQQAA
jgi:hypothetical protein